MSIYFTIDAVLDRIEQIPATADRAHLQTMIPVTTAMPEGDGPAADIFTLASSPNLLDLQDEQSAGDLALLLQSAPLYQINMQMALDEALAERHNNSVVCRALEKAFAPDPLPHTLSSGSAHQDETTGSLRHPMLEHMDPATLCRLYVLLLRYLPPAHKDYNFERNILGKHPERFMAAFDGFIAPGGGKVKAEILIAFGMRHDHGTPQPAAHYSENGRKAAQAMNIGDPHELLWAWLEADDYQMRRCRAIDRLLRLRGLPRIPNWVRQDIGLCFGRDAMKQYFAQQIINADRTLSFAANAPQLRAALAVSAAGHADEALLRLHEETGTGEAYRNSAGTFAAAAAARAREAQKERLV